MIIKAITGATLPNYHVVRAWSFITRTGITVGTAEENIIRSGSQNFPETNYITNFQYREVFSGYEASGTVVTLEKS